MIQRIFASVALVDCTKLSTWHLPGIKKLENEIKIQKIIYYYFHFLILKDENRRVNYTSLPSTQRCLNYTPLPSYVKIYNPLPFIQNILENISLTSPKRNLNYILLPSHVKIYTLIHQYIFFISNNLAKK